jgi:hypothetical protein
MTSTTGHNCVSTACQQICQPSFGISRGANLCQRLQIRPCLNLPEPLVRPCPNPAQDPCSLQKWFSARIMRKMHGERTGNVRGTCGERYGERTGNVEFCGTFSDMLERTCCVYFFLFIAWARSAVNYDVPRAFPVRSPNVPRTFPVRFPCITASRLFAVAMRREGRISPDAQNLSSHLQTCGILTEPLHRLDIPSEACPRSRTFQISPNLTNPNLSRHFPTCRIFSHPVHILDIHSKACSRFRTSPISPNRPNPLRIFHHLLIPPTRANKTTRANKCRMKMTQIWLL